MSLAFLSKKGWHTSNLQNVEKVWIAEQKQEKEAKRVLELQKQIEEERQIDDLRALQRNQGLVTDPREKLEWMYEGPSSGAGQDRESVAQAAEYKDRFSRERMGRDWTPECDTWLPEACVPDVSRVRCMMRTGTQIREVIYRLSAGMTLSEQQWTPTRPSKIPRQAIAPRDRTS